MFEEVEAEASGRIFAQREHSYSLGYVVFVHSGSTAVEDEEGEGTLQQDLARCRWNWVCIDSVYLPCSGWQSCECRN